MMELDLPSQIFIRLQRYVKSVPRLADTTRTSHWAIYGARNRISFQPAHSRIQFEGGVGFDSCYSLNFSPLGLSGWFKQRRILWQTHAVTRLFTQAFLATSVRRVLDLEEVSKILGLPLTPHKPLAAYYFNLIQPYLANRNSFQYLEIGAGSGYLAALFHQLCCCKVIIVDLPEILPFSFIYLHRVFPQADFQLPNEVESAGDFSRTAKFIFLSPDQIDLIPDNTVDLAINTASFGEMLPQQILIYFNLLRRAMSANGLFFTSNRVEKWMSTSMPQTEERPSNGQIAVRFNEYPWRVDDRDIFYGLSEYHKFIQPENPFLQRLCRLAPP